jgi:hypothetical protein
MKITTFTLDNGRTATVRMVRPAHDLDWYYDDEEDQDDEEELAVAQ